MAYTKFSDGHIVRWDDTIQIGSEIETIFYRNLEEAVVVSIKYRNPKEEYESGETYPTSWDSEQILPPIIFYSISGESEVYADSSCCISKAQKII